MQPALSEQSAPPGSTGTDRRLQLVLVLAAVVFVGWAVWGAAGVRGTDQYWYVADVASLVEGRGVQTNHVYPNVVRDGLEGRPPFVHNILPVYLAAVPALVVGPYAGWIVLNVGCALLAAALIFLTARRLAASAAGAAAGVLFLALPVTLWQATQPLAEASISALVALAVYQYVTAGTDIRRWGGVLGTAALLYFARPTFVVLLPLVPLGYLAAVRRAGSGFPKKGWAGAGLLFAGAVLAWRLVPVLFPAYQTVSYVGAIGGAARGDLLFLPPPESISPDILWRQIREAARIQFAQANAVGLGIFWPFTILALSGLAAATRARTPEERRLARAVWLLMAVHVATAVLFRNQFRYTLVATPPLLVAVAVFGFRSDVWTPGRMTVAALGLLMLALPAQWATARAARVGAHVEQRARLDLRALVDRCLPGDAVTLVAYHPETGHAAIGVGYALRPRLVVYIHPEMTPPDEAAALAQRVGARWLLAPSGSPFAAPVSPARPTRVCAETLPSPYGAMGVYRLDP